MAPLAFSTAILALFWFGRAPAIKKGMYGAAARCGASYGRFGGFTAWPGGAVGFTGTCDVEAGLIGIRC